METYLNKAGVSTSGLSRYLDQGGSIAYARIKRDNYSDEKPAYEWVARVTKADGEQGKVVTDTFNDRRFATLESLFVFHCRYFDNGQLCVPVGVEEWSKEHHRKKKKK